MQKVRRIRFKLTGDRYPINWQVPINNQMQFKKLPDGKTVRKKIHYIPGVESPFVEDYKGDEKPVKIWMQDGYLDVREDDPALLQIMRNHDLNGVEWLEENKEIEADEKLSKFELIEKALVKVNISQVDEARATALVIIGEGVISKSDKEIKASLKQMAIDNPRDLLAEMNHTDYYSKYVAALSVMREIVLITPTQTAVTWPDGKVIINVAAGESPIAEFGKFLSQNDPISKVTLQRIGEISKRKYEFKVEEKLHEKVDTLMDDKSVSLDKDTPPMTIEEARQMYEEIYEKDVPVNKKNDIDWIQEKLAEKEVEA